MSVPLGFYSVQASVTLDYELLVVSEQDVEARVKPCLQKELRNLPAFLDLLVFLPLGLAGLRVDTGAHPLPNFPGKMETWNCFKFDQLRRELSWVPLRFGPVPQSSENPGRAPPGPLQPELLCPVWALGPPAPMIHGTCLPLGLVLFFSSTACLLDSVLDHFSFVWQIFARGIYSLTLNMAM